MRQRVKYFAVVGTIPKGDPLPGGDPSPFVAPFPLDKNSPVTDPTASQHNNCYTKEPPLLTLWCYPIAEHYVN